MVFVKKMLILKRIIAKKEITAYIKCMPDSWRKYIAGLVLIFALAGCSKDSSTGPNVFNSGAVSFLNSGTYTVILEQLRHNRGVESMSENLDRTITTGGRYQLPNLLDGGIVFQGGDRVSLVYRSRAVDHSGNPLFEKSLSFLVNGSTVVTVKGQEGEYDISGN